MASSVWTQDGHDAQRTGASPVEPEEGWTLFGQYNASDSAGGLGGHFYDAPREARPVCSATALFVPAGPSPDGGYVPAGLNGITALDLVNAPVANPWTLRTLWTALPAPAYVVASPAYVPEADVLIAASTNGTVYKLLGASGFTAGSYAAGSPVRKAVLARWPYAYVVCDDGSLHKIDVRTMLLAWSTPYRPTLAAHVDAAGSSTPPAFSGRFGLVVYGTADLNVHGVSDALGTATWKTKVSTLSTTASDSGLQTFTLANGVPVLAEKSGYAFVMVRNVSDTNGSGVGQLARTGAASLGQPGTPGTNTAIRAALSGNNQHLYALNLSTGSATDFVPAVPYTSMESYDLVGSQPRGVLGHWPVVKVWPDGTECLYVLFRSYLSYVNTTVSAQGVDDTRWTARLGEVQLPGFVTPGMSAGDVRWVAFSSFVGQGNGGSQGGGTDPGVAFGTPAIGVADCWKADESPPLTMGGATVIGSHFEGHFAAKITNRGATGGQYYGSDAASPNGFGTDAWKHQTPMTARPTVLHAISAASAGAFSSSHHFGTTNPVTVEEGITGARGEATAASGTFARYYDVARPPSSGGAPGEGKPLYTYWPNNGAYSPGLRCTTALPSLDRYITVGGGGDILVLAHSGTFTRPTAGALS